MRNRIILGTAQFGMDYGISNKKGKINFLEITKILNYLDKRKINYLETANAYNLSEFEIGKYYLKSNKKFKVITKYSLSNKLDIFQQYKNSIKNLKYKPQVIMAHNSKDYLNSKFRSNLFRLKKEFKIKKVGVSIYTPSEFYKIVEVKKPDILQVPCNILDKRFLNKDIIEIIKKRKIKLHARSIFLQGLFFKNKKEIIRKFKDAKNVLKYLENICKKENLKLWELSLLWVYHKKEINRLIIGVDSEKQIKKNISLLKKKLKVSLIKQLDEINMNTSNIIKPNLWIEK
tara:strand:- start:186 stop:1049 length:864 start_codon:yes stop_codon:yes gene_type:complete